MLLLNNLSVKIGDKQILSNLNMSFPKAQIHGIVGFNGSGKTTLLNAIYGLRKTNPAGAISYDGEVLERMNISFLETNNYFYSNITGVEYLQLFCENKLFEVKQWQEIFQLPLSDFISSYSTGMKKKLAFLSVIATDRDIMLFDEPHNGLDIESVYLVQLILNKLKERGKTIIITSHIADLLFDICDDISIISNSTASKKYSKEMFGDLKRDFNDMMQHKYLSKIDELL